MSNLDPPPTLPTSSRSPDDATAELLAAAAVRRLSDDQTPTGLTLAEPNMRIMFEGSAEQQDNLNDSTTPDDAIPRSAGLMVEGNMETLLRSHSTPSLGALEAAAASSLHSSPGLNAQHSRQQPQPLYPKRLTEAAADALLLAQQARSGAVSVPSSPVPYAAPDGATGCAPAMPSTGVSPKLPPTAMGRGISSPHLGPLTAPHHNHRVRHELGLGAADDEEHGEESERSSIDAPEMGLRPSYEKGEDGRYVLSAAAVPSNGIPIPRNKSARSLASMPQPSSGPRQPHVALVTPTLSATSITRATSGENYHPFHRNKGERLPFNRLRIDYATFQPNVESTQIAIQIHQALELRTKFVWTPCRDESQHDIFHTPPYQAPTADAPLPPKVDDVYYQFVDGVFSCWKGSEDMADESNVRYTAPNRKEFGIAMGAIMDLVASGPAKTFCHNRLHVLEARFNLHELLNHDLETLVQKSVPHRDFYNVRKIDNHVHHSAAMNQKHLLRFIKSKLKRSGDEKVIIRDGKELTLAQVFESLNMTAYDLNVDTLDMHADKTFHRFDKFNLKYNPVGESRLREIFLKYNNHIQGRYLAELTQQVFDDLESNKYQLSEYRLSIYGAKPREWQALAEWVVDFNLWSPNVRWMIQIPRLYSIYRANGQIKNFAEMLHNIFDDLFRVSVDPSYSPKLHLFLQSCVGFDMVDDESLREKPYNDMMPAPEQWDYEYDPPYALFAYYLYANLISLNKLRASRGFSTLAFRPHAGEAGDVEHLAATFLLAKSINHGLVLQKSPALQYLYYLSQIGLSMSPLSNNLLFLEYDKNPFPRFFRRGLNVTLSTDDPLMIHVTREPLVEEYSVASQVWKLSAIDMSEIARNSVLQSGWEQRFKSHFIGNNYWLRGEKGNDIRQTNLPDVRIQFRAELLGDEFRMLQKHSKMPFTEALIDRII